MRWEEDEEEDEGNTLLEEVEERGLGDNCR